MGTAKWLPKFRSAAAFKVKQSKPFVLPYSYVGNYLQVDTA